MGRGSKTLSLSAAIDRAAELDRNRTSARFVPTGLQEDIIQPFGDLEAESITIIYVSSSNKIGKTATGAAILRNVIGDYDSDYFDYPVFREWPFPKTGRIIGTVKNTSDDGPIRREIETWIPRDWYECQKVAKSYTSQYKAKNGFSWDVMTYKQDPQEFEGPLLGWQWCDEPPKASLMGAILSRFSKGGVLLITATPVGSNVGPFLDVLDDLERRGTKVRYVYGDISQNCVETGKPNHLGTKRGLMTPKEIKDYEEIIPLDEREARLKGKPDHKSGKVYKEFDVTIHVKDYNLDSDYFRQSNCYCVMDPHRKAYPAITWWAHTPDEKLICYNEFPTVEFLNSYYYEVRKKMVCPYDAEKISQFISICDLTNLGYSIYRRGIDPRFARGTEGEFGKGTESIVTDFAKHLKPSFELPPFDNIATGRNAIRADLKSYDKNVPLTEYNMPKLQILPHCRNMIMSLNRHYWEDDKERESEEHKDFIDTLRVLYGLIGGEPYKQNNGRKRTFKTVVPARDADVREPAKIVSGYEDYLMDISMS